MAESYDPRLTPYVTDQRGDRWHGVPGFSSQAIRRSNSRPYSRSKPITPLKGKKPPEHPDYRAACNRYAFYAASYNGGAEYNDANDANGLPVFVNHPNEGDDQAKMRKRLAVVRNYSYAICSKLGNYIFSQPIVRSVDTKFAEWAEDVDGNGTCLSEFMEDVSEEARVYGIYAVIFDTTKADDDQTVSEAQANGNRPILSCLHPNRIINWNPDRTELLIRHDVGPFGEVWLWSKLTVQRFALDEKGKIASVGAVEPHGYPQCPVVLISGLNDFRSIIRDVAQIQKRLFNLDSVLVDEIQKQTFTSYLLLGISNTEMGSDAAVSIGGRKFTLINKDKDKVEAVRIGSDISQAESIRSSMDADEREIFRIMGLRLPDANPSHPESGRAIRLTEGETVAMAERIAANTESCESRLTDLYNFATGQAIEAPRYPDEFNEDDLQVLLNDTLAIMAGAFGPEMKAEQNIKLIRQNFRDLDPQRRNELEQEAIKQAKEAEASKQEAQQQAQQAAAPPGGQPGVPLAEERAKSDDQSRDKKPKP